MELATGQFNDAYTPIMDGVSMVVKNYARWLNRTLGPCCVVTPEFPGYRDREDFPVLRYRSVPIPHRRPYRMGVPNIDIPFQIRLKRRPFHLIHCHSPFSAAGLALKIARQRGIPLVATFHSKWKENLQRSLRMKRLVTYKMKRIVNFFNQADEVWSPSESAIATLREYGYHGHVEVVHNGVDMETPRGIDAYRHDGNTYLETTDKDNVLLYVGQLAWEKNLTLTLKALQRLKKKETHFKMVFVGEGYARKRLISMTRKLGLIPQVEFTGVITDRERLKAYYGRADLFLFPSLYDTAGLVVKEAAAFKVPALLLNGATAAEGIVDGRNGFLSDHSPEAFGRKIETLLANKTTLRRVGDEAFRTLFTPWSRVAEEVKQRYLAIAARYPSIHPTR
ncbi:MAG: glycosyltransferase [Fidelibacterota bacterium]